MPNSADALRRWLGAFFLAMAFGLLVWGQTVLSPHLKGIPFVIYWLFCFLFTFAAIFMALLDLRVTRRRSRTAQKELLHEAFKDIDADKNHRPPQENR